MEYIKKINEAAEYLRERMKFFPKTGIILGSGLGEFADNLKCAQYFQYGDIPNFPVSTVKGHKGRFVVTENLICMQGRFHFYEGYSLLDVTMPVRVMSLLGVKNLIVTNAAGGINDSFEPGDLMIITDHVNMMGTNPLIGKNIDEFGERFPDMSEAYSRNLIEMAEKSSEYVNAKVKKGVYFAMTGPSYETPAEVKMIKLLGGDAVGMSTVPEVVVANHCAMNVLGISCITNMAAGISKSHLNHKEVIAASDLAKHKFISLIEKIVENI